MGTRSQWFRSARRVSCVRGLVSVMPVASIRPRLLRALAGDSEAVGWLYDRFAPRLLRRLTGRFDRVPGLDPADLLQDTFVYVLSHEGKVLRRFLDGKSKVSGLALDRFLWSAACGIVSNRRRSLARRPTVPLDDRRRHGVATGGEEPALARDVLERLARCLLRRGDRSYLYYQLRYRNGLTPAEVTTVTGWSSRTTYKLKQILDRALDRCLEEMGIER